MRYLLPLMLLMVSFALAPPAAALQTSPPMTPPCGQRATAVYQPWLEAGLACLEQVVDDPNAGELAFTALTTAPDGTLYAARPLAGEVLALTDSDGDTLLDTTQVVADGLTLPNALDYHDGALYISGGSHVYRLRDGQLDTLVSDLPSGGGFWTGGIAVGDDGRIYVATGAPCDFCIADDPARGAILSFALDGSDRQIVASGLRQPAALAFQSSDLYVVDSARAGLFDTPDLDEVDRVQPGANFGFPYCVGLHDAPDMPGFDCAQATPPVIALPTASTPVALAAYNGTMFRALEGKLLVVLSGSYNDLSLRGYQVVVADPQAGTYDPFMPHRPDDSPANDFTVEQMNYRGSGFFPQRPLGVAVNAQGWIYISVGGGVILSLRR